MTESSPSIRIATSADAEPAARLLHDFNSEFDSPTPGVAVLAPRLDRLLAAAEVTILLGGAGPDGIAVLRLRPSIFEAGPTAYLEELYVAPAMRGRGLGRALLEATMAEARRAGAARIELGTEEGDVAARALYESAGFTNQSDGETMYFYERDL
jgi:GNAT superfamily N-acetyltransferase